MKRIFYIRPIKFIIKVIFSLFYNKQYLRGKYFDIKRMGWIWCFRSLSSRIIGPNRKIPWPVNKNTIVSNKDNIEFHVDSINIFQSFGCYFQNHNAKIYIGRNVHIAPNCGIITTNHDVFDVEKHLQGKDVSIGDNSWIGMNSVILPGVILGKNTIVGAGSVVTKSFENGNCVIGGVPAKIIKNLSIDEGVNI